jgi:hypothetical protein
MYQIRAGASNPPCAFRGRIAQIKRIVITDL